MASILAFLAFLAFILGCSEVVCTSISETSPNHGWISEGCDGMDLQQIFGTIHFSIRRHTLGLLLPLNADWMDRFALPSAIVKVTCTTLNGLVSLEEPNAEKIPASEAEEILQVIYVHIPESAYSLASQYNNSVDAFLARHPCWELIQDVPYMDTGDKELTKGELLRIKQASNTVSASILVRLPAYPYAMTCKFLTALRERQFPATCPQDQDLFVNTKLGSNGFAGEGQQVMRSFLHNLAYSATQVHSKLHLNNYQPFLWADKNNCPEDVYKADPFACSFLPHSGCRATAFPEETTEEWQGFQFDEKLREPHKTLESLGIDEDELRQYGDGVGLIDSHIRSPLVAWTTLRTYLFLFRPRIRLRHFIRTALHRVHKLTKADHIDHRDKHEMSGPCIGVHVRNGDSMTDFRQDRPVDRSLNGAVYYSLNISKALGIKNLFLTTDNSSLSQIVPFEYPDFNWYTQPRVMMPVDLKDPWKIMNHNHLWNDDPNAELGALFADMLVTGGCRALVGQGDGSVTLFYNILQCSLASRNQCPPFFNLEKQKGYAPYVGRRYNASTYATYFSFLEHR